MTVFLGRTCPTGMRACSTARPVTWSGEANGVSVELSCVQTLESGTGAMGRGLLQIYRESSVSDIFSFLDGSGEEIDVTDPQPGAGFTSVENGIRVQAGNPGGTPYNIKLEVEPGWNDPEIVPSGSSSRRAYSSLSHGTGAYDNHAAFYYSDTLPLLQEGETTAYFWESGGASGSIEQELQRFIAPDFYTVAVQKGAEEPFQIPLTPRYTTPDGGAFTLDGEEGPQ